MNRLVFPPEFDSAQIARLLQRTTLALVVSLALPIICLAACVFFLVNAVGWVERSNRVIEQAHAIDKELVTMQTNFRGFRLTSDQTYADRFKSARQSLPQHLVLLETLVANSTKNRTEVSSLRAEIKTWLKYIDGEFLAGRDDPAVMRSPGSLRGAPLFDATQARLEGIIAGERRLQEQRNWRRDVVVASSFGALALLAFLGIPFLVSWVRGRLRRVSRLFGDALDAEQIRSRELSVTLFSIGDAVIATDARGYISFLNLEAENLTGWSNAEARGVALHEVFRIFNEHSGEVVESPVDRVLRENVVVGLANHTVLRSRTGREVPIEDSAAPIRHENGDLHGVILVFRDATESRIAQREMVERERRLRLLNELGEGTRALVEPVEIMEVSIRLLGQYLRASRCAYAEVSPDSEHFRILHDYTEGCASNVGAYALSQFGTRAARAIRSGETLVLNNIAEELPWEDGSRTFAGIGVQAIVCCPLIKEGVVRAMMAVHQTTPRIWLPSEISLIEEIVERCWATIERARAEAEVRLRAAVADLRANIVLELNHGTELHPTLQNCCSWLELNPRTIKASIWRFDSSPGNLLPAINSPGENPGNGPNSGVVSLSDSVVKTIIKTRAIYLSNDLASDTHFGDLDERFAASARAFAGFPLIAQDELLGVAGIFSDQAFSGSTIADLGSVFDIISRHVSQSMADTDLKEATARADSASKAVAETAERFRILSEVIPLQVWTAGPTGELDFANSACQQYFGVSEIASILGHAWTTFVHPEDLPSAQVLWEQSLKSGSRYEVEFRLRRFDGEFRWFLVRAEAERLDRGQITKWFGTNTDVHDLKVAKAEAERSARAKDEFLAVLSHELRTPLTPALMTAAELRDDLQLPEEVRSQLAMIERNIGLEARLIDDLLDLTRISKNKLPIRLEPCDAHSLIGLAVDIIKDEALAKAITLKLRLSAKKCALLADPSRFQQVIWNLLRNAVKFTPEGGQIEIETANEADGGSEQLLRIEVRDSGIGIDAEALPRIFEPFEQAERGGSRRFGGMGLGLSIAQSIVNLHGGSIGAASAGAGRGSTFTVRLPGAADLYAGLVELPSPDLAHGSTGQAIEAELVNRRILLVEDHESTLRVMTRLLTNAGYHVVPVATVREGLAAAAREPFDLVVSDLGLPDGTGNDLMRQLKEKHNLRGIALTGYGMDEDIARSQAAGFVAHLIKPVDFAMLKRTIAATQHH